MQADPGARETPGRLSETAAVILLPIGAIAIPLVGWFIGVALLWRSPVWTTREKLVGTLVIPGGLGAPLALAFVGAEWRACNGGTVTERFPDGTPKIIEGPFDCESAGVIPSPWLAILCLALVVASVGSAIYLWRRTTKPAT